MLDPYSPTGQQIQPLSPSPPPAPRLRGGGAKPLFSDHYLRHRLPEHPEWDEDVTEPFERLRALYDAKRDILPTLIEAQTEEEFIRPALRILGFAYIVQTPTRSAGRVQRPDYALFADEDTKEEAYPFQREEPAAFYARALAIADAKYWERPLSETRRDDSRDTFRNINPLFQIVNYLIGTGVDWGIMTNGRLWRLHYRQASSTATEFYEVDLVEALESGDLERFKYFWLFFRRDAFIKDAQGNTFLDRVREGSATYARMVGDQLKDRVFEKVFPYLAGGFVAYCAAHSEDVISEETRRAVYEATLSLLYKMLFLLYAEARDLLPIGNPGYRAQSLTRMAQEVAGRMRLAEPLGHTSTALYDRLLNLFHLIDQGDPGLGLPRYNGGLFHLNLDDPADREKHAANWFLTQHRVSDAFLAPAVDLLYRADGEPVDYGYIGVRHLGAIYEGLLEHRLAMDEAASGEVHLETDKGERKATGSYYTPDYVVKYIVHHTVGPILEERAQHFDELMAQITEVRRKLADGRYRANISTLRQKLERLEHQARETLLDIKVCDPAMGSGHFLVEAVDFLTDGLIEVLNRYPDLNPILAMLERIRRDIVASLQRQGISIDPARLDDTQLLQRVVMKRCIYGVDLNPMAVELAKVSLWLHSFTIGAPLSFLDHHLRCGNSLIGATARDVDRALRITEQAQRVSRESRVLAEGRGEKVREAVTAYQGELWGGPFAGLLRAAEIMRGISLLSDATFTEVEESERLFRQFDEAAKPYKRLLDIFVSRHFGVKRADEFLRLYGADAIQAGPESVGEPYAEVMRQARELYQEKRFFHWDLEFPEVFIDLERATWKVNPGFDAVVGNPPYVSHGEMRTSDPQSQKVLEELYPKVVQGHWDLYVTFIYRSLLLVRSGGFQSFITPSSLGFEKYATAMRRYILEECWLALLVDFGEHRVFDEVARQYLIYVASPGRPIGPTKVYTFTRVDFEEKTIIEQAKFLTFSNLSFRTDIAQEDIRLKEKVEAQSIRLGTLCFVTFGVHAYSRSGGEVRFTTRDVIHRGAPLPGYKRYVEGKALSRHNVAWTGLYLDYESKRKYFHRPKFPELFESPKLMVRRISGEDNRLLGCYDTEGYYTNDNIIHAVIWDETIRTLQSSGEYEIDLQVLDYGLPYITVLVNSIVTTWYFSSFMATGTLQGTYSGIYPEDIRRLPIRRIEFTTPPNERSRLVGIGITETTEFTEHTEGAASVSFSAFSASAFGRWLDERLSPTHTPDPALVRQHNADPLNEDWQLREEGPVEQSDVVHDLLAHLAVQMIEMNKQKQAEVKGFLQWLEREIGVPIDNLTRKTYLRNYLGDYQKREPHLTLEELLDILRRNRRLLGVNPTARDFQEQLEREYRDSLDTLLPLKAHLATTDRLIDLIVYRLYGLTEEEVAAVEGAR